MVYDFAPARSQFRAEHVLQRIRLQSVERFHRPPYHSFVLVERHQTSPDVDSRPGNAGQIA
jgi:hypothetical protein